MTIGTNVGSDRSELGLVQRLAACIAQPIAVFDRDRSVVDFENDAMRVLDIDRELFALACVAAARATDQPQTFVDNLGGRWQIVASSRSDNGSDGRWLVAIANVPVDEPTTTDSIDPLTGAIDRRGLDAWVSRHWPTGAGCDSDFGLLFIDFDGFKRINDKFGHPCGDQALADFAARLRESIRDRDRLFRYGGDEFLVVADGVSTREHLDIVERRVSRVADQPVEVAGQWVTIGVSVGGAYVSEGFDAFADMLAVADKRMYANKRQLGETN